MTVFEVGILEKGDACAVLFPDGRSPWLCRVVAALAYDDTLSSMYECLTPHGSVVVTGAVWVRLLTDEEKQTLLSVEAAAKEKGLTLYKGRIRSADSYVGCHAARDGECSWSDCPQLRDNEPERSGRHCPYDREDDRY